MNDKESRICSIAKELKVKIKMRDDVMSGAFIRLTAFSACNFFVVLDL